MLFSFNNEKNRFPSFLLPYMFFKNTFQVNCHLHNFKTSCIEHCFSPFTFAFGPSTSCFACIVNIFLTIVYRVFQLYFTYISFLLVYRRAIYFYLFFLYQVTELCPVSSELIILHIIGSPTYLNPPVVSGREITKL